MGALEFYWAGNKNIPQDQQTGYYARGATSYYFNHVGNWFTKEIQSVGSTFGYKFVDATRLPRGNDSVYFTELLNNSELGLSGNYPTNPCLFGGLSGASGISGGQTWFGATGTSAQLSDWLYLLSVDKSYGNPTGYPLAGVSFDLGNTFGTTYGKNAFISGISASTTISGLTGLSGNTTGTLIFTNYDGSSITFGVSAGISFAGSGQTYAGESGDGTTLIGTKFIYGNTFATRSLYLALNSAITAGTLKMTITDYTGAGDTEFTLTQNIPGLNGNREVGGSLLTATGGVVGGTMGVTVGNSSSITGGRGITEENSLRLSASVMNIFSDTATNLVDSRTHRTTILGKGQFNTKRGYINQFISSRDGFDVDERSTGEPGPQTSTYILDTDIGNSISIAGGTYSNLRYVGTTYESEDNAHQPITYIRASGGIPTAIIRAFRMGTVQLESDITTLSVYPEKSHIGGAAAQGFVSLTRSFDNSTRFNVPTCTLHEFNPISDPSGIMGTTSNTNLILNCGLTIGNLQIESGTVRVGSDVGNRPITIVDGNIRGRGYLKARSETNPSYQQIKIGGQELSTGVTLPEGLLVADPSARIEFSTGHYVIADFIGDTGADAGNKEPGAPTPTPPILGP